jgi:hypothetical protein
MSGSAAGRGEKAKDLSKQSDEESERLGEDSPLNLAKP